MVNKAIDDLLKYGVTLYSQSGYSPFKNLGANGTIGTGLVAFFSKTDVAGNEPYRTQDAVATTYWRGSMWRAGGGDGNDWFGFWSKRPLLLLNLTLINSSTGGWEKNINQFKIQGSNNTTNGTNGTWVDLTGTLSNPSNAAGASYLIPINNTVPYHSIRIYIFSFFNWTGNNDWAQVGDLYINAIAL